MTIPDWLSHYGAFLQKQLGLARFDITLSVSDAPGGDKANMGYTVTELRYSRAQITFRSDAQPNEEWYQVITHEYFHPTRAHLAMNMDRIVQLIPERLHEHAFDLWDDGNEPDIENESRALFPLLWAEYERQNKQGD